MKKAKAKAKDEIAEWLKKNSNSGRAGLAEIHNPGAMIRLHYLARPLSFL
jgi:hypothetical protein